ncbi:hypothetical protein KKC17_00770 [Patescibacteria group bacterium]|nr:hypothetical protein [Patescibacteria group bacterium]
MENIYQQILEDIYQLEPGLRQREGELIKILQALTMARPALVIDENFKNELKNQLLNKFAKRPTNFWSTYFGVIGNYFRSPVLGWGVSGILLLVILTVQFLPKLDYQINSNKLIGLPDRAFGSLLSQPAIKQATGLGGGGGLSLAAPRAESLSADSSASAKSLIYPAPYQPQPSLNYVYKGEKIDDLPSSSMVVQYQPSSSSGSIRGLFGQLGKLPLDLSKFNDLSLQSWSLSQNKEFGYIVSWSGSEGQLSLGENWAYWPHPEANCRDEACVIQNRITQEQLLPNDQLISIANKFLSDINFDLSDYGQPIVNKDWPRVLAQTVSGQEIYYPDTMTVLYPWSLQDKEVYELSGGQPVGLTVSVSLRSQRVTGLWGAQLNSFVGSAYEMETDFDRLLKLALQGGWQSDIYYIMESNQPGGDVELMTPKLIYAKWWQQKENSGQFLYVPALLFPVNNFNSHQNQLNQVGVVVPLVKELVDQALANNGQNNRPTPQSWPMIEPFTDSIDQPAVKSRELLPK